MGLEQFEGIVVPLVRLARSGFQTSRVGFGTSRLHYLKTSSLRQRLLAEAADLGIRHFDTAPCYGDGLAERELGYFLRSQRERLIIATKWGIPASRVIEFLGPFATAGRVGRVAMRRFGVSKRPLPRLTVALLRQSFDQSRRRLGIDCIDILFVHEPNLERIDRPNEIADELENMRSRGLIANYGLAGAMRGIRPVVYGTPNIALILQTSEYDWDNGSDLIPDITFSALARAPQSVFSTGPSTASALEALRSALQRRPNGVVLVSTTNRAHLRDLVQVASEIDR